MATRARTADDVAELFCDGRSDKGLTVKQVTWLKNLYNKEIRAAGHIPDRRNASGECNVHGFNVWYLTVLPNGAGIIRYR